MTTLEITERTRRLESNGSQSRTRLLVYRSHPVSGYVRDTAPVLVFLCVTRHWVPKLNGTTFAGRDVPGPLNAPSFCALPSLSTLRNKRTVHSLRRSGAFVRDTSAAFRIEDEREWGCVKLSCSHTCAPMVDPSRVLQGGILFVTLVKSTCADYAFTLSS